MITNKQNIIAVFSLTAISLYVVLRYGTSNPTVVSDLTLAELPLIACLICGGIPLVLELLFKLFRAEFGSDLLAGMSIITAVVLGEFLAGALVVLMLSGGEALESYAVRNASSVLKALAKRMPSVAHRKDEAGRLSDQPLEKVAVGDVLVVFPHENCPVDGTVVEGHGVMDESYLTGEPYLMSKVPGSAVLSGAINGQTALSIRADKAAADSRFAKIMQVMRDSEQRRPRLRRLGDQLGAFYTPVALAVALLAWSVSGEAIRFLAVLVVATPCPLLIAIPVAIIGSISLSARRGIIIKDPVVLEKIDGCRTAIFDKTGTLTYGEPKLIDVVASTNFQPDEVLRFVASLEQYSKHPLAAAVIERATEQKFVLAEASEVSERPGRGLLGRVAGQRIQVTNRKKLVQQRPEIAPELPAAIAGMECVVLVNDRYAATLRFRDQPRQEGAVFVNHLRPKHHFDKVMIVSGDRESEVRYLADLVGIHEVHASQSPEQKVELVRKETRLANTVFLGDGINDAPALTAATVGIAFGQNCDVTSEAAGAVIMDSSLQRVDEFLHIGRRMRSVALQSAVGGMSLSLVGMLFAAAGYLPPVAGAVAQEIIDVLAVLNALRAAVPPRILSDY